MFVTNGPGRPLSPLDPFLPISFHLRGLGYGGRQLRANVRNKEDGAEKAHESQRSRRVACTSSRYIKEGCKFGRVGFLDFLVGYSVRHFVGRRAKKIRHSLPRTPNRAVGG